MAQRYHTMNFVHRGRTFSNYLLQDELDSNVGYIYVRNGHKNGCKALRCKMGCGCVATIIDETQSLAHQQAQHSADCKGRIENFEREIFVLHHADGSMIETPDWAMKLQPMERKLKAQVAEAINVSFSYEIFYFTSKLKFVFSDIAWTVRNLPDTERRRRRIQRRRRVHFCSACYRSGKCSGYCE